MPKISIVTPSFNQGDYIEETILSVINQNYPNLEYIIIDGGSTDGTLDIIRKYEDKISYWISEPDKGQADAINKGFDRATGDYVNWLNSDDILLKESLSILAKYCLENPEICFFYGDWLTIDPSSKVIKERICHPNLGLEAIYDFPYGQPACFYSREKMIELGGINPSFQFTMDYDLFVRFAAVAQSLHVPHKLAGFRVHDDAKSSTGSYLVKWRKDSFRVFSCLLRTAELHTEIYHANRMGIYIKDKSKYSIELDNDTIKKIREAFAFFAARWAHYFYQTKQHKYANRIISYVKSESLEAYTKYNLSQIEIRSRFRVNMLKWW